MNAMNPSFWDYSLLGFVLDSSQPTGCANCRGTTKEGTLSWQPFNASVQSWIGHARYGDTEGLRRVLLAGALFIPEEPIGGRLR